MKVFSWNEIKEDLERDYSQSYFKSGSGISIGSFDGLHKGHRVLLNTLVNYCREKKILSGVVSFSRPLPSVKHKEDYQGDISTLDQRLKLFESLGIDFAIIVDFDDEFASIKGIEFLQMLVNACNMTYIAEGIDFRCGYMGSTDASSIKLFAENNNVKYDFVDPVFYNNGTEEDRISSSYIRSMVLKRFFTTATELLERPYSIQIVVNSEGQVFSRELTSQAVPPVGAYHCKLDGEEIRVEITENDIICHFTDSQKYKSGDIINIDFE